jgi:hypothetical protein
MGDLFVTCVQNGAPTDQSIIRVAVDGSPVFDSPASLFPQAIDLGSSAAVVNVDVTPFDSSVWPLSGSFSYDGQDTLTRDAGTVEEFIVAAIPPAPMGLFCHLSALRDASDQAAQVLGIGSWGLPELDIDVLQDPPITGNQLGFDVSQTVNPASTDAVLEIAGTDVPRVISVSWPDGVPRDSSSVPFVIYFRPTTAQNPQDFQGFPYPFSEPYMRFCLRNFMAYDGGPGAASVRPLGAAVFSKGIPYQLAAAGANAVTVLASPRFGNQPEFGRWMDGLFVEHILGQVAAFFARRGGFYLPQFISRVACGCFSSGAIFLADFLESNHSTSLYQDLLRELWVFDAVDGNDGLGRPQARRVMQHAIQWQQQGDDRLIRAYTQHSWIAEYQQLVGAPPTRPGSGVSADLNTKIMLLDQPTWQRTTATASSQGELLPTVSNNWFQAVHQLIAATLLTDAARNSRF